MSSIITLTTDFGVVDGYVAAMKGAVLSINPDAKLVDISHSIPARDIGQASFVLSTAYHYFPQRTVHIVVVDPGVGTARRGVILRTPVYDFVAPDNGVLSRIIEETLDRPVDRAQDVVLPGSLQAFAITRHEYWRSPVASTFHGRDIFAPVAARLSLGTPPAVFGETTNSLLVLPAYRPRRLEDGTLVGRVQHIDSFGNLITNIRGEDLPAGRITIEIGRNEISGLSETYAAGVGLLALVGSAGYVEIAVKDGSAAATTDAGIGLEVRVRPCS